MPQGGQIQVGPEILNMGGGMDQAVGHSVALLLNVWSCISGVNITWELVRTSVSGLPWTY